MLLNSEDDFSTLLSPSVTLEPKYCAKLIVSVYADPKFFTKG